MAVQNSTKQYKTGSTKLQEEDWQPKLVVISRSRSKDFLATFYRVLVSIFLLGLDLY